MNKFVITSVIAYFMDRNWALQEIQLSVDNVGTDLSAAITWVGLGLYVAEPHHFSSCVRVN